MNQVQVNSFYMKGRTPLDEPTLVSQLNALLNSLRIPILLISPTDLTPRLLIAILESILGVRIPIFERHDDSHVSKVQNIKIFLGILETDILKKDVGLSYLDPCRLADGELKEVTFVAELLCWIGRRMKLIKLRKAPTVAPVSQFKKRDLRLSTIAVPNVIQSSTTAKMSTHLESSQLHKETAPAVQSSTSTDFSTSLNDSPFINHPFDEGSLTSFNEDYPLLQPPFEHKPQEERHKDAVSSISEILGGLPETLNTKHKENPRRIHPHVDRNGISSTFGRSQSPEYLIDSRTSLPPTANDIRYNGYIEPVDEESEITAFALSRSISITPEGTFDCSIQDDIPPISTSVRERYVRTLELLNERTKLLTHLAELKKSDPFG